ncbi:alpha/beta hydrolase [Microbacterium sp. CCNWLW134]|uniref:alpha/beta fold hydrolase n=1 Tax=Microbacterium sp. CCNWLW134 TaxID=3122064 RepID=UPI00300FC85A
MDVLLVPGLWLTASSWNEVVPGLRSAGLSPVPLTMPGVRRGDAPPDPATADIGIDEWIDAVVAEIDRREAPVVLVGHSGGGNVIYGAADLRPTRVAHLVFLDTFPPSDGGIISEFPIDGDTVSFPGWDFFDDDDVDDLDADVRDRAMAHIGVVPRRVPTDPVSLTDDRRREIPATILTNTVSPEQIEAIRQDPPAWAAGLAAHGPLRAVSLRAPDEASGHWPQFSKPDAVARAIAETLGR